MNRFFRLIRTTVIGGFVFLVPVVFVIILGEKAIDILRKIAAPIVNRLGLESTILGFGTANVVTVLVIILLCFLAGLIARSAFGSRIYAFIDDKLIAIIPQYAFVKSMTPGGTETDFEAALKPVLVTLDDSAMIAFVSDQTAGEAVTVFVPGAPNPWSGSILHVEASRVQPLDVPFSEVVRCLRVVGRGSSKLFKAAGVHDVNTVTGQ